MAEFDLLIIGAGPAGLAAAKQAAQLGLNVAIAEQNHLGGCCVNRGCVPKKLMVHAADYGAALKQAAAYGWENRGWENRDWENRGPKGSSGGFNWSFNWPEFRARRNQELQRLRQVQQQALEKAGVHLLRGQARFVDPQTVAIQDQPYRADKFLIAVGGKPIKPEITGIEHTLNSDELLNLEDIPQRIAIIGGGYIGVEFASILREWGSEITIMNRESCILEGFDTELSEAVRAGLMQRGIRSLCGTTTDQITPTAAGLRLNLTGNCSELLLADVVLCAVGRAPALEGLALENAGVEFDKKAIAVDEFSRTNQSHIYAVGDCTNRKQLTPVARAEGRAAVDTMVGQAFRLDYSLIPSAVLSRPEAAAVGLTEAEARTRYGNAVTCLRKQFVSLQFSLLDPKPPSLIKLVIEAKSDRVLGLHMVGEQAGEIVQSAAMALQQGMTHRQLSQAIGIHPSIAEELFSIQ